MNQLFGLQHRRDIAIIKGVVANNKARKGRGNTWGIE